MAASTNDYLKKTGAGTVTSLAAPGKALSATSITVGSTTNYPSDTGIVIAIRQVDSNGDLIAGTYTEWSATVTSPTTLSIVATPVYGSDQIYAAGSTTQVYIPVSSYAHNKLIDGLLAAGMNQTGSFENIVADTVTANEFITAGANANGWTVGLPTPDTVTYNGNRSYGLVFNSNDITDTVSNGMRTRFTRTVTPPTQCTDLEASSSQYWSKTSPAGTTFTDDFCAGAWIKLESYGTVTIVSRTDTNSGWRLFVGSSGQVYLQGTNANAANFSRVVSYQSIPLNKWVHIAAQLDMSAFTATTTTSYIMIDGVNVPAFVERSGTNPTALVQAGNLNIGAEAGGTNPFDGKIAQAWYSSAKITQATIQGYISQGMSGSETSIVSLFKFNGDGNDSNANANNLTANAGATATTVDSPFNATEYGIITANSFSTNTTLTVQVPEGYAIPTSGGVSAVAYSTQDVPYGFPSSGAKWEIEVLSTSAVAQTISSTWGNYGQIYALIPVGSWEIEGSLNGTTFRNGGTATSIDGAFSESTSSVTGGYEKSVTFGGSGASPGTNDYVANVTVTPKISKTYSSATTIYLISYWLSAGGSPVLSRGNSGSGMHHITARPNFF